MKTVAIIGATGMLGRPVTQSFINEGWQVRILARNTEKAHRLFGSSVNVVQGDIKDKSTPRELLHGQDAVYMNLSCVAAHMHHWRPRRRATT